MAVVDFKLRKRFINFFFPFLMTHDSEWKAIGKHFEDVIKEYTACDNVLNNNFNYQLTDLKDKIKALEEDFIFAQKMRGSIERGMLYALAFRVKIITEKSGYNQKIEIDFVTNAIKKDFPGLSEDELKTVIKTIYNES